MEQNFDKKQLTKKSENISEWYNDVVKLADLADYSETKGCMIIKPLGYALWESVQKTMDKWFKDDEIKNVYFPMLIPMSLIQKEKEHIEGFAPELLTVDRIGDEKLNDPYVLRPTSETIMYKTFANWIQGYRDLPIKINQWCNIFRAEKRTYPFLRTAEFLWQEGHTAFQNEEENLLMVFKALNWYKEFYEKYFAISPYVGLKSQMEKFAGAKNTYAIEIVTPNGKALQAGTSHDLADNFAKAFEVQFLNEKGEKKYVYQSSFGLSTRSIGALILAHGDDSGLVLPPMVAPTQVVIMPILKKNEGDVVVLDKAHEICNILKKENIRVFIDKDDNHSLGYRINEHELRGTPLRLEIGSKEIENKKIKLVRRDNFEKFEIEENEIADKVKEVLDLIQANLFDKSEKARIEQTKEAENYEEFKKLILEDKYFVRAFFCEDKECETKIKEETKASTRCLEFDHMHDIEDGKCIYCNKKAEHKWLFGKSY